MSRPVSEVEARLRLLDEELARAGVEVELCLVGRAAIALVFDARAETRRPSALFASRSVFDEAVSSVAERMGLPSGWLPESARRLVGPGGPSGGLFEGRALRVFGARPEYVLAMRCAAIAFPPDPETEREARADLTYLLRYLGVRDAHQATEILEPFLNERQRPADLDALLANALR